MFPFLPKRVNCAPWYRSSRTTLSPSGNFLSKFQPLRQFYRSPEVITRVAREVVEDAVSDGIRYLELRFTPVALSRSQNFPLASVMDWVLETTQRNQRQIRHHNPPDRQCQPP